MKKPFICIFPLLLLSTVLWGQSTVAKQDGASSFQERSQQEAVAGDEAINSENGLTGFGVTELLLTEQELQSQLLNWENLAKTSLDQYLEGFRLFLEQSQAHYELQPYVLAECLWFQVAVLPQFQKVQQDGSLDKMMELNMKSLSQVQQQVTDFLARLEEGIVAVHPWSDTVVTFFQELVHNPIIGFGDAPLLEYGSLPELPSFEDDHFFVPVEGSYRNALLYHGLMDFHQLVSQFDQAMGAGNISDTISQSEVGDATAGETEPNAESVDGASADAGSKAVPEPEDAAGGKELVAGWPELVLPPPVGGIDWSQVVANQTLMYLLRHLPSGGKAYSFLLDYHTGETAASQCEDLYLANCKLTEQWGFALEAALPDFSAAAIQAVEDDLFVLYCLPVNDLERLSADLSCVSTMASAYFERTVSLLHRPAGKNNPVKENGGPL